VRADENRAWVKSVTDRIERGPVGRDQQRFRFTVNTNLLHALGGGEKFRGLSVAQVLDASAAEVTGRGFVPRYEREYERELRDLSWPDWIL
jgi:hypothetical protein